MANPIVPILYRQLLKLAKIYDSNPPLKFACNTVIHNRRKSNKQRAPLIDEIINDLYGKKDDLIITYLPKKSFYDLVMEKFHASRSINQLHKKTTTSEICDTNTQQLDEEINAAFDGFRFLKTSVVNNESIDSFLRYMTQL